MSCGGGWGNYWWQGWKGGNSSGGWWDRGGQASRDRGGKGDHGGQDRGGKGDRGGKASRDEWKKDPADVGYGWSTKNMKAWGQLDRANDHPARLPSSGIAVSHDERQYETAQARQDAEEQKIKNPGGGQMHQHPPWECCTLLWPWGVREMNEWMQDQNWWNNLRAEAAAWGDNVTQHTTKRVAHYPGGRGNHLLHINGPNRMYWYQTIRADMEGGRRTKYLPPPMMDMKKIADWRPPFPARRKDWLAVQAQSNANPRGVFFLPGIKGGRIQNLIYGPGTSSQDCAPPPTCPTPELKSYDPPKLNSRHARRTEAAEQGLPTEVREPKTCATEVREPRKR